MRRRAADDQDGHDRIAVVRTTKRTREFYRHLRREAGFGRSTANVMVAGFCLSDEGNGRVGVGRPGQTITELLKATDA